jgi:hypothetical protein
MPKTKKEWPKTMDEAVERLMVELSDEDKKILKSTPKKELVKYHFGFGMHIRNEFGLWKGNKDLLESCCGGGYSHDPDEASSVIIRALWERLQKS